MATKFVWDCGVLAEITAEPIACAANGNLHKTVSGTDYDVVLVSRDTATYATIDAAVAAYEADRLEYYDRWIKRYDGQIEQLYAEIATYEERRTHVMDELNRLPEHIQRVRATRSLRTEAV